MHATQVERTRRYRDTPKGAYTVHKANAKQRGVEFNLTFDEWWKLWSDSKRWTRRGNRSGRYVMCRKGDVGAYELGNVYIGTFNRNVRERNKSVVVKRQHTARSTTVTFEGAAV